MSVFSTSVHMRHMIRRDKPEVLAIDQESHANPWSEEMLLARLRERDCIGMIAEHRDRIVGYMVYSLMPTAIVIDRFAVATDCRRSGVGSQMMSKLIGKLSSQRRNRIKATVRETQLDFQLFARSQGFLATSVIRGFFTSTGEDAYMMEYRLDADAEVNP